MNIYQQIMESLFDNQTHKKVLQRIELLSEQSQPQWGIMNVGQMLKHCQIPLEVANGTKELDEKVGFGKKLLFRFFKSAMYNDKPWGKNIATPKDFKVVDQHVFETEKAHLIKVINEFHSKGLNLHWPKHPFFGHFTTDQWGKMQYKHLDHHLRQFGV